MISRMAISAHLLAAKISSANINKRKIVLLLFICWLLEAMNIIKTTIINLNDKRSKITEMWYRIANYINSK